MTWQIDPAHSQISFSVRHMMIATVRGEFESFDGTVNYNEDRPEKTTVDIQIDAASINTRESDRDKHLRSADFLNAEEYPYLTFKSKRVIVEDNNVGRLVGDLTIRGITREVTLDVEYAGQGKSPWGTIIAGFSASTAINRKNWDLNWNAALETGGFLVGDTIKIEIELELVKQTAPEEAPVGEVA